VILRWVPFLIALAGLAWFGWYHRPTSENLAYVVPAVMLLWVTIAFLISASPGGRNIPENARGASPFWIAAIVGLAVLVLLLAVLRVVNPLLLPIVLTIEHVCVASKKPKFTVALTLVMVLPSFALIEGFLVFLRSSPTLASKAVFHDLATRLYRTDWKVLQFEKDCTRFDPELLYTLKPGSCIFSNTEFRTRLNINRLGMRDDEQSLDGPEIIVAGDSHAMGWGLEHAQTYAASIERTTGRKVLASAIASYGTARELIILKRVDRAKTRILIIHYNLNDREENQSFLSHGNSLPRSEITRYYASEKYYRESRRYFPGKYLSYALNGVLSLIGKRIRTARGVPPSSDRVPRDAASKPNASPHAEALFGVLQNSPISLTALHLILITPYGDAPPWPSMGEQVLAMFDADRGKPRPLSIHVIEEDNLLGPEDHLPLDNHTNASGHAKIAREVLRIIKTL